MDTHDNLYDKLSAEFDSFIEDLKNKSPDEIVKAAYEKVFKEDILLTFEERELSSQEIANLMILESPLDYLYREWLDTDASYMDMLRDCIDDATKKLIKAEPAGIDTQAINGKIACFDLVVSIGNSDYPFLVGEVNAVEKLGSEEHDSDNPTDDVFVDFRSEAYSEQRIKEIEEHFSKQYGEPKKFEDLSLDNVIMAHDMLIRISESDLDMLLESGEAAQNYRSAVLAEYADNELVSKIHKPKIDRKPSIEERLKAGKEKSDEYRAQNPVNHTKNEKEI